MQSAAVGSPIPGDPDSHPTVESFRLAMGTSSRLEPLVPPDPSTAPQATAAPAVTLPEATPPDGMRPPTPVVARGPRRTRESLRVDAIKPPLPRKR
ncbi:MAG TPA: hypothetical protein VF469_35760 [Kofleriaceae bacterium]